MDVLEQVILLGIGTEIGLYLRGGWYAAVNTQRRESLLPPTESQHAHIFDRPLGARSIAVHRQIGRASLPEGMGGPKTT